MPAIMIGVGGTGGNILNEIRRRVNATVVGKDNSESANAQAREISYHLLDTRQESFHTMFSPVNVFNIPSGRQKFGVDGLVEQLDKGDPDYFFNKWWPRDGSRSLHPYYPGDFNQGAGQVRAKGKLAYRMHIANPDGPSLFQSVLNSVHSQMSALGPATTRAMTQIPVYIVGSLGGGTGSGIIPALALHLRDILPENCVIVGAVLLASITERATTSADRTNIWANTDAALREIDFYQLHAHERRDDLGHYMEWPGQGNNITAKWAPFKYVYLFGGSNRDGLTLPTFDDYCRLVAECLLTEVFSPISAQIGGPHAQFIQQFANYPRMRGRPTSYASAAKADVIVPVDRIATHLARSLGATILQNRFVESEAVEPRSHVEAGEAEAKTFLSSNNLLWRAGVSEVFGKTLTPGDGSDLQEEPTLDPKKATDPFAKSGKEDTLRIATETHEAFEEWRTNAFVPAVQLLATERERILGGPRGAIVDFIVEQLSHDGYGYFRALGATRTLLEELKSQERMVKDDLEGPKGDGGLKARRAEHVNELASAHEDLGRAFGRILSGSNVFGRTKAARNAYVEAWDQIKAENRDYIVADASGPVYRNCIDLLAKVNDALIRYGNNLNLLGNRLAKQATGDLGNHGQGNILEVKILDDPKLVTYVFREDIQKALDVESHRIASLLLSSAKGIAETLRDEITRSFTIGNAQSVGQQRIEREVEQILLREGRDYFHKIVSDYSIWEALAAECDARQRVPGMVDTALEEALTAVGEMRKDLANAGQSDINEDHRLLAKYIERKLQVCKNRAQPFWRLDQTMVSTHTRDDAQLPYPLTVLAYDQAVFESFVQGSPVHENLIGDLADQLQVRASHLPGNHSISIYAREGVVPLFFLQRSERDGMYDRSTQVLQTRVLYSDRRFKDVIDRAILPGEDPEDVIRYVLSLGMITEVVRDDEIVAPMHYRISLIDPLVGLNERFMTYTDAVEELHKDSELRIKLMQSVLPVWEAMLSDPPQVRYALRDQQTTALRQQNIAVAEDRRFWARLASIIGLRLTQDIFGFTPASLQLPGAQVPQPAPTRESIIDSPIIVEV